MFYQKNFEKISVINYFKKYQINVSGKSLNRLRYADDIVLITDKKRRTTEMIEELKTETKKLSIKINLGKTKYKTNQMEELNITIADEKIKKLYVKLNLH